MPNVILYLIIAAIIILNIIHFNAFLVHHKATRRKFDADDERIKEMLRIMENFNKADIIMMEQIILITSTLPTLSKDLTGEDKKYVDNVVNNILDPDSEEEEK